MQHNRKKKDAASVSEADKAYERKLVSEGYALLKKLLTRYAEDEQISKETFCLSAKLLRLNPEISTLWNIRRKFILALPDSVPFIQSKVNIDAHNLSTADKRQTEGTVGNNNFQIEILESKKNQNTSDTVNKGNLPSSIDSQSQAAARDNLEHSGTFPSTKEEGESSLDGKSEAWQKAATTELSTTSDLNKHHSTFWEGTQKEFLLADLKLTEEALRKLPKGFCIWHHRLWTLRQLIKQSYADFALLKQELLLCSMFLKMDARNFHCWQHRSFVCALIKTVSPIVALASDNACEEEEMNAFVLDAVNQTFSRDLIESNFSNYSAWHLRSTLPIKRVDLLSELRWLREGLYTEPEDQSLWKYYQWLLFTRGCATPRLLKCLAASTLHTFYFFFSETYSLLESAASTIFYDGTQIFHIQGTWKPINARSFGYASGCNPRIKGKRSNFSYAWRFQVTYATLKIPVHQSECTGDYTINDEILYQPHFYFVIPIHVYGTLSTADVCAENISFKEVHVRAFVPSKWHAKPFEKYEGALEDATVDTGKEAIFFEFLKFDIRRFQKTSDGMDASKMNDPYPDMRSVSPAAFSSVSSFDILAADGYNTSAAWETIDPSCPEPAVMKTIGKGVTTAILKEELCMIEELAALEPTCKYVLLTRCQILEVLNPLDPNIEMYYKSLSEIDHERRQYYNDCRAVIRLKYVNSFLKLISTVLGLKLVAFISYVFRLTKLI